MDDWSTVRFRLCVLSLLLTLASSARAERLPLRTYTTADGLPRDNINRIIQDSKGFLWFCTSEGLSRFDGYRFTNYGTGQGLAARRINDFLETRNGVYWAATDKGLCRFVTDATPQTTPTTTQAAQRFVAYYPGADEGARSINAICEDHNGTVWCGTDAGLYRLDQKDGKPVFSFVDIIQPAGVYKEKRRIVAVTEDRGASIWIIALSGLYRLRPDGVVERYTEGDGVRAGFSLLADRDGRIWLAAAVGVFELVSDPKPHHPLVARFYTTKDGLANKSVSSLYQSSDGTVWAATAGGLSAFLPARNRVAGRFRSYTAVNGLSNIEITTLCEDRAHNLWIGTASGGAMRLAPTGFSTYDEHDGMGRTQRVSAIIENRAGELCAFGDALYVGKLDQTRFTRVPLTLPAGVATWSWAWYQATFQDSAGEWWMTTGDGLVRYPRLANTEQLTHARPRAIYKVRDGLPATLIFRLYEDSRRDIWISTLGNENGVLTRWNRATETFQRYTPADGIPQHAPTAFAEDGAGNLWIGFYEGGLLRYRDGGFTPFTALDGVPPGMVRGLYLDHARRLWVATSDGGVARVDDPGAAQPSFVAYSTAEGLSSNQANCVTEDQWGMIYVGTGRGLDKLDPATGHLRHFTTADGLANTFVNVSFRHRDGSLWFGTLQGVSRLIPAPDRPASPPPMFITTLRIAGTEYPIPELGSVSVAGPELGANQNNIQIDFAGLGLAAGESLRYQYKLEGASSEWSAPVDQRSVNYPNLPPGSYRFWVRALSSDGTLSETPATVTFRVLPPVWRRWWFETVAALLVASALTAFGLFRAARLRALRESETRFRTLAETASDAIITVDQNSRIVLVNQATEKVFGYGSADMLGQDLAMLMPEYLRHIHQQGFARYNETGVRHISWQGVELPGLHKDGHEIPLEVSFGEFTKGDRRFFTGIARDVTERKRAERERKLVEDALIKTREERLAELEQVRKRIATDLHDDIGSSLTQISILSEVVLQKTAENGSPNGEPLSMIARSSRELVDSMSDIVWAINPQKDHLSDLTGRMRRFASDVLTARNVAFEFLEPDEHQDVPLGANVRREVYLIFKESVNNLVRHSGCTEAGIEFQIRDGALKLQVRDNGKGFDLRQDVEGHGLASMRQRAMGIGGRLEIASQSSRGTIITLELGLSHRD